MKADIDLHIGAGIMKRRLFLAGLIGAGLFAVFHKRGPTQAELASAKKLAIDPGGERYVFIDGWITDVRQ